MSKASLSERQRFLGDEVEVFAPHRREHAVPRVDPFAQDRDLDALLAPLVGADQAEQFAHRGHIGRRGRAVDLRAGLSHLGRAAQRHRVAGVERQQQHAQRARALRLRQPVLVERLGHVGRRLGRALGLAVGAAGHGLEQLARVLEVAAPEQGHAFAGQPERRVGGRLVIGNHHALWRRQAGLGAPQRAALGAVFGPVDGGEGGGVRHIYIEGGARHIGRQS